MYAQFIVREIDTLAWSEEVVERWEETGSKKEAHWTQQWSARYHTRRVHTQK